MKKTLAALVIAAATLIPTAAMAAPLYTDPEPDQFTEMISEGYSATFAAWVVVTMGDWLTENGMWCMFMGGCGS